MPKRTWWMKMKIFFGLAVFFNIFMTLSLAQQITSIADERLRERQEELARAVTQYSAESAALTARVVALEQLTLDRRLTRLEAYAESNRDILIAVAIAIALMLVEAVTRLIGYGKIALKKHEAD